MSAAITKQVFITAARQVKSILSGAWTNEPPAWVDDCGIGASFGDVIETSTEHLGNVDRNRVRAVWTAEAYIILFRAFNPRFDEQRFLAACGLVVAPPKGRKHGA